MNAREFMQKQGLPYEAKIAHAEIKAWEFYNRCENVHISVGGLDSITLLLFLRSIGIGLPAISVSCIEDASIQKVHKSLGIIPLKPYKSQEQTIKEFGFPVLSKEIAKKIEALQNPSERNATSRHAYMTGIKGNGEYQPMMKLSQCWIEKFAGLENEKYGTSYCTAPFCVSAKCCYYSKEKPCGDWAKQNNSSPFVGLMASEGGRRKKTLMLNGCNFYGKSVTRSAPFAIFSRQDLLRLAVELNVPVPEIYGKIVKDENGELRTTKAQRTGCYICGFGIHMEKRPHRFDRMRVDNMRLWQHCMFDLGWGDVLDYIGVGWRDEPPAAPQAEGEEER